MIEDVIRGFGFVMLGSRMRRLGERLQSDTQRLFEEEGMTILPAQFAFLAAVDRLQPLTIGELAQALGVAQPGVTRTVTQLVEAGLLAAQQSDNDQRRRVVTLTEEGRLLVERARRDLWPRIEAAVRELCQDLSGPLMDQLATMEDRLAEKPLERRAPARKKEASTSAHPLDRPVWGALTTRHAKLARGGNLARRYAPELQSFICARDDSAEALDEMSSLVGAGEKLFLLQADRPSLPWGIAATMTATAVQMIGDRRFEAVEAPQVQELDQADAQEMMDLATLTKPGPFSLRALDLGRFWGIRSGGRLAAMAGERMRQDGFVELSGVCVHPDFRGKGLARLLSLFVAGKVAEGGDIPYLHAYATNAPAIRLYQSIGFRLRCEMFVAVIERA